MSDAAGARLRQLAIFVCCCAVCAPIIAGVVGLRRDGWVPDLDNAAITARVGQILDGHPQLVGMPSTLQGEVIGPSLITHHPGPLLFWLLAPLYGLTGRSPASIALGAGLISASAAITVVVLLFRRGGAVAALIGALAVLILERAMTTDVLVSVFNPYFSIVPLVAAVVCVGSIASRDSVAWIPFVFFSSLVAQSHLSGVLPMAALWIVAVAVQIAIHRHATARTSSRTFRSTTSPREPLIAPVSSRFAACIAALACVFWAPVAIDQLFGSHNLTNLMTATGNRPQGGGLRYGFGFVASAIGLPARFMMGDHRGTVLALGPKWWISLLVGMAMLALGMFGWIRGRRSEAVGLGASLLMLVVCGAQASRIPVDSMSAQPWIFTTWHVNYWVLSLGCASWLFAVLVIVGLVAPRWVSPANTSDTRRGAASRVRVEGGVKHPAVYSAVVALLIVGVIGAAALPQRSRGAMGTKRLSAVIETLTASTRETTQGGHWLAQSNVYDASIFGGVMAQLMASGTHLVVPNDTVYYWGEPTRCTTSASLDGVLLFRREPDGDPTDLPAGARLIARTSGPSEYSDRLQAALQHLESVLQANHGVTYDPQAAAQFVSRIPHADASTRDSLMPPFRTIMSPAGTVDGWAVVGLLELADAGIIENPDVRSAALQIDEAGFGAITEVGDAARVSVYAAPASAAVGCGDDSPN